MLLQVESINDKSREQLQTIKDTGTFPDPKVLVDLQKRQLVKMQKIITFEISQGPKFSKEFVKEETDLTADMLARWVWTLLWNVRSGERLTEVVDRGKQSS